MKKIKLSDFKKYCYNERPYKFLVKVDYCLSASFDSVEISLLPDIIYFWDSNENCLSIHGISSLYKDGDSFIVYSNYFGTDIQIRIHCEMYNIYDT